MLTVSEKMEGGFIAVGGSVLFVERKGNRVRLTVDAPKETRILRSDSIKKMLESQGFTMKGVNRWFKGGKEYTLKAAINGNEMDPPDSNAAA